MHTEIEVKFYGVSHDEVREKLRNHGATCVRPMRVMKRMNFDFPDRRLDRERYAWVRVRDEGGHVSMSFKQVEDRSMHGTKEINLVVDSYEAAKDFLTNIGLEQKSYQESKRESWTLDGVDIELDEWPWVPPYIELEAKTEKSLRSVADKLQLDWSLTAYGSIEVLYTKKYNVTVEEINSMDRIEFGAVPAWLQEKIR